MGATTNYYNALKIQLDAQAAAKKNALDIAYERATTAQFDAQGKMSRKEGKGPGTLDVQYDEQQRQLSYGAEASGTLKSGQFGRDLATSQAAYRTAVVGGAAETEAAKTEITNETASELAKYQAMYNTPLAGNTAGGAGGGAGGGNNQNDPLGDIKPPEDFSLGNKPNPQLKQTTSNIPSTKKPVINKKPANKVVPVPNKVKTIRKF